ncbi:hypothetical protein GCM10011610_52690 [Nocardia rhizosphaerihabitans]|uniref:Uncharacterized protein n=1 Tax=Nocardia rhizosphaerihabitans TaxID=1691570 RepID=A0ABQ2KSJ4_9NOCA|nr:hypothetical protein GCM10011610_52690 [Nocardia rhizosphaerihabitans]
MGGLRHIRVGGTGADPHREHREREHTGTTDCGASRIHRFSSGQVPSTVPTGPHRVQDEVPITAIDGQTVRLTHPPTDLVFDEK